MDSAPDARPLPPDEMERNGCSLRALTVSDWAIEQALSRDPDVVRWTYYPADMTEWESRQRIEVALDRFQQGLVRRYAIVADGEEPVGTCGIGELSSDCPSIFYAVRAEARTRGLATEAARMLAAWALANGYPTVALETVEGNEPSERVARKAGFVPAGRREAVHRGRTVWLTRWTRTALR